MEIDDQRTPQGPHFGAALGYTHTNIIPDEKGYQAADAQRTFYLQ
jgi:hypothetical protein